MSRTRQIGNKAMRGNRRQYPERTPRTAQQENPMTSTTSTEPSPSVQFTATYAPCPTKAGNLMVDMSGLRSLEGHPFAFATQPNTSILVTTSDANGTFGIRLYDYTGKLDSKLIQLLLNCFGKEDAELIREALLQLNHEHCAQYDDEKRKIDYSIQYDGEDEQEVSYGTSNRKELNLSPDMPALVLNLSELLAVLQAINEG